jgi:hypothetical protein
MRIYSAKSIPIWISQATGEWNIFYSPSLLLYYPSGVTPVAQMHEKTALTARC